MIPLKVLKLKASELFLIKWIYLPLYFVHRLTDIIFLNDEIFGNFRAILLSCFGLKIFKSSKFGKNIFVSDYSRLYIGAHSFINNCVYFDTKENVVIGVGCSVGFRTTFITGSHSVQSNYISQRPLNLEKCKPIKIEDFVWIGANATILPGITVGRGSVVAAGAIVTKDVPGNTIVAGCPAKKIRDIAIG